MDAIPINRSLIYSEVEAERRQADETYGGVAHDDGHLPNDWVVLVTRYAGKAAAYPVCVDVWGEADRERFRANMLRVASVAISAIEYADRRAGK